MNAPPRWLPIVFLALIGLGIALPHVPRPDIDIPFVTPVTYPGSYVILVEESAERPMQIIKFVDDVDYQQSLTNRGLKWRIYDDDSAEGKRYAEAAKTVPGLVIQAADKKILYAGALPDSIDATVKKVTGL